MKQRLILAVFIVGLVAGGALVVVNDSSAQTSTNYGLVWHVVAGGGGEMSSASYRLNSTLGQTVSGEFSNTNYRLQVAGYWQMFAAGPGEGDVYLPIILRNYSP
jgi:uncharacterized membrane protein